MVKGKYKAVIFDFDDTLTKTHLVKWAHHKATAKKFYNIDLTEETIRKHWGKPLQVLIPELYGKAQDYEKMLGDYISLKDEFLKGETEGAKETVQTLLDKGVKVGILSATNKDLLLDDLKRLGFPVEHFAEIQGAEDTSVHKPEPEVFLPILKKFAEHGVKKEEIVYIGDSLDDYLSATGAGLDYIGITTGIHSEEDFKKAKAKKIIKDIRELPDAVL